MSIAERETNERRTNELPADEEILTPTVRRFFRRSLFWIAIATIIVIIAFVGMVFSSGTFASQDPLGPDNPAPEGAKALVEVLRHEGVDVTLATSLREAERSIVDPAATTLVVSDVNALLTDQQWRDVTGLADTVVLIDPNFAALTEVAPDVFQTGLVEDVDLEPGCRLDAAEAAGTITGAGTGFRTTGTTIATCFKSGDDTYSLIQVERDGATITLLGATEALSNGRIVENGNAALALTLLGSQPDLTWYTPGINDYDGAPATLADFTPDWVIPVSITLLLTVIAAAVWRGRRFGPLIVENLPVTVRASETMHGRARLYQHSSARLHAIDSLRIGTIDRLARLLGFPSLATVDEIVTGVAAMTGRAQSDVRRLLVDAAPQTDRELVSLSDQLLTLEAEVATRLRSQ